MAKYVKNPAGAVHSVPDDFEAPAEWGIDWSVVAEADAHEADPRLAGEPDPAVVAAELHDGGSDVPVEVDGTIDYPTSDGPHEPQPLDADGQPIPAPADDDAPEGGDAA